MQEGFQPASFQSSRSSRAAVKAQGVDDFLDEDEKVEKAKAVVVVKVNAGLDLSVMFCLCSTSVSRSCLGNQDTGGDAGHNTYETRQLIPS